MNRKSLIGNPLAAPRQSLPEIIAVYWRDSSFNSEYDTGEDAWPYILLYDVGWLIREDEDGIVFCSEVSDAYDSKQARHVSAIPKENIISQPQNAVARLKARKVREHIGHGEGALCATPSTREKTF